MLTYIYFVKCPGCEDEHFDFFDDAKDFALSCLSKKPIITQVEIDRNDFGECNDSSDLGTVWSWEDMMEAEDAPAKSIFTKDDLKRMANGQDPEFDNIDNSLDFDTIDDAIDFLVKDEEEAIAGYEKVEDAIEDFDVVNKKEILDTIDHIKEEEEEHIEELVALCNTEAASKGKPVPEGMTIEQLVEEMEENEDEVECTWCNELFGKDQCRKEVDLGWLCDRCQAAIKSRGEPLTFRENDYWDFLDENIEQPTDRELDEWVSNQADKSEELIDEFDSDKLIKLEYKDLTVTVTTGYTPASGLNPPEYDEEDMTQDFTYEVSAGDIATAIWENFITEEDVKEFQGGLDALEDDEHWQAFLAMHFEDLLSKYYDKLLELFRSDAEKAAEEEFQDDYARSLEDGPDPDAEYDSWYNESCHKHPIKETVDSRDLVELEYPSLTVTLYGEKRAEDDWDEEEYTNSHVYLVPKLEVATVIWENWITEEDAEDVLGGLQTLEDDRLWNLYLETHFDDLFEKYNKQILEYFKEEATEDFRERSQEETQLNRWSAKQKQAYADLEDDFNESAQKPFLEEFDDAETHKASLTDCPECGSVSYDMKEQYCTNCGLNL